MYFSYHYIIIHNLPNISVIQKILNSIQQIEFIHCIYVCVKSYWKLIVSKIRLTSIELLRFYKNPLQATAYNKVTEWLKMQHRHGSSFDNFFRKKFKLKTIDNILTQWHEDKWDTMVWLIHTAYWSIKFWSA